MRIDTKKYFVVLSAILATVLLVWAAALAGRLAPPSGPDNATSAMYTLEDIYNYLDTGVAGTKRTGGATEPSSVPVSTGHTLDDIHKKVEETCFETCDGILNGTRWCDQEDGTVKDMTTGLVWLKNATCIGNRRMIDEYSTNDAITSCVMLSSGNCGLNDGSAMGDWRLPTKDELVGLLTGAEKIDPTTPGAFTGSGEGEVWSSFDGWYWTSTPAAQTETSWLFVNIAYYPSDDSEILIGMLGILNPFGALVWPVRSDN